MIRLRVKEEVASIDATIRLSKDTGVPTRKGIVRLYSPIGEYSRTIPLHVGTPVLTALFSYA